MSYLIAGLGLLVVAVIWLARNREAIERRMAQEEQKACVRITGHSCYHGVARYDPDWEA